MKYRPEIDGLRAVAVVPVVISHLNPRWLPGGFVGVDIFFVISGFLITQLISEEIDAGEYSIARFYVRRARRIFPALFFMCACYCVFALREYLPDEIESFKSSLIAATLFVSNIYFFFTDSYFGPRASSLPLLHTWSLAVEEQFYLAFPLLLLFLRKQVPAAERWILALLALISLLISAHLVDSDQSSAAFYLPHSRAWELLAGSLVALNAFPTVRHRAVAETLAVLGLGFILFSVFTYDRRTDFPGFAALFPCVGAALIIHSGAATTPVVARLLALKPIRFIGLISYSLYLWHWPINVGLRLFHDPLGSVGTLVALVASFTAAVLSWKYIERPFRRPTGQRKSAGALVVAGSAMAALLAVALLLQTASLLRWQLNPQEKAILALQMHNFGADMRGDKCLLTGASNDLTYFDQQTCLKQSATRPNYLLLGDSHAAHLWPGLLQVDPDVNLMQATASGCTPLIDNPGRTTRCTQLLHFVFTEFLPHNHLDGIILSGRWSAEAIASTRATIDTLSRYADHVVLLGPSPVYQHSLPRTVVISLEAHDPTSITRDLSNEGRLVDTLLTAGMIGSPARYFSVYQALCPAGRCQVFDSDGLPMQFDNEHFTVNGSIDVARRIRASGVLGLSDSPLAAASFPK
jgi:peptidoglycan/LPS O-acetylase OafA/YrhL